MKTYSLQLPATAANQNRCVLLFTIGSILIHTTTAVYFTPKLSQNNRLPGGRNHLQQHPAVVDNVKDIYYEYRRPVSSLDFVDYLDDDLVSRMNKRSQLSQRRGMQGKETYYRRDLRQEKCGDVGCNSALMGVWVRLMCCPGVSI